MVISPLPSASPGGQAPTSLLPSAMLTMIRSSFTVTSPSWPQSPVHATDVCVGEAVAVGVVVGEVDGVAVGGGEVEGVGVGGGDATVVCVGVTENVGVGCVNVAVVDGVGVGGREPVFAKTARALSARPAT